MAVMTDEPLDDTELLGAAYARAQSWEPVLDAWAHLPQPTAARAVTTPGVALPLSGVLFGVKDVIDVKGMPTRCGSLTLAGADPALADAPIVAALRRAGGVPVGKTRTTEFAFTDPTTTRNPFNPSHSPGGSSSGSGAVVGAGIVPFALGTQTAGSLCRPACYCGAPSYKPSLGLLPNAGMMPLSPSFDTIGVIAQTAFWLRRLFDILAAAFALPPAPAMRGDDMALRIGFLPQPEQNPAPDMLAAMQAAIGALRQAGHHVEETNSPVSFVDAVSHHRTVMLVEAAQNILPRLGGQRHLLQPNLATALRQGEVITAADYDAAQRWIGQARKVFWQALGGFDLLLAYPVPGAAPNGLSTTGDQSYLTPWTVMAGPLVSLPVGCNMEGLPLGILLGAAPGRDGFLVTAADRLAGLFPATPQPLLR